MTEAAAERSGLDFRNSQFSDAKGPSTGPVRWEIKSTAAESFLNLPAESNRFQPGVNELFHVEDAEAKIRELSDEPSRIVKNPLHRRAHRSSGCSMLSIFLFRPWCFSPPPSTMPSTPMITKPSVLAFGWLELERKCQRALVIFI